MHDPKTAQLLAVLLEKPMSSKNLEPFVDDVLHPKAVGFSSLKDYLNPFSGKFSDSSWYAYKNIFNPRWDVVGTFSGAKPTLGVLASPDGSNNYQYTPDAKDPFTFTRANGQVITPGTMLTDDGSIPRIFWAIPGLNPWLYTWGYLLHDWLFMTHHCTPNFNYTFEDANAVLAEAIYTMMQTSLTPQDWRILVAIYTAVNSYVGEQVWNKPWTLDQCNAALNSTPVLNSPPGGTA